MRVGYPYHDVATGFLDGEYTISIASRGGYTLAMIVTTYTTAAPLTDGAPAR